MDEPRRACPNCAEMIVASATLCRFCKTRFDGAGEPVGSDMTEMVGLQSRINLLQGLYVVLFVGSLAVILGQHARFGFGFDPTLLWAGLLGGAVVTRIYRSSLVNRYNMLVAGRRGEPPRMM